MHLVTAAELRAIERQRIARKGIAGQELMELAGFATAEKMLTWRPDLQTGERRMIVLCGPGGNGGDGFVTARLLAERGWRVELYWFGAPERQPPDAAAARARWEAGGGETRPWSGAAAAVAQGMGGRGADAADVVLEALFGIGLSRPMPAEIVAALGPMLAPDRTPPAPALEDRTAAPRDGAAVVSVDMPSGLCADGGRPIGPAVQADMTMTFVAPKLGQFLLPGLSLCGELRFSRLIGSARPDRGGQAPRARLLREAPQGLSKEACAPWGHKYDHGHVLAVA
ncbi:MAG: NAD(P)H-hydrate epimerase, partial [Pseudomonadota bacterium]